MRELTPISELLIDTSSDVVNDQVSRTYFINNMSNLMPIDRIGVDVKKLSMLCQMGGIWRLLISMDHNGETSSVNNMITGVNPDGSALMGQGASSNSVPLEETDHRKFYLFSSQPFAATWLVAQTNLNSQEMSKRIIDDERYGRNIRSEKGWSNLLDESLKNSIRDLSGKLLIKGQNHDQKRLSIGAYLCGVISVLLANTLTHTTVMDINLMQSDLLKIFGMATVIDQVLLRVAWRFMTDKYNHIPIPECLKHYRASLIYGPQIDRYLLVQLLSRTGRLVSPIS